MRLALILLLALLLPLKGMAAWAMAGCAAAPAAVVAQLPVPQADEASPPCHGEPAAAADAAQDASADPLHSACSHTSPCCAAVMAAPAQAAAAAVVHAHAVWVAAPPCTDSSVSPPALERPPKRGADLD